MGENFDKKKISNPDKTVIKTRKSTQPDKTVNKTRQTNKQNKL